MDVGIPECVLDGMPIPVDSAFKTWNELLEALDHRLAAGRRAVTVVRFGGVDQPSFREVDRGGLALSSLGRLDVESLDIRTLLQNTVLVTEGTLTTLAGGSRRVAEAFRGTDLADANAQLVGFLGAVGNLTTLTGAIGQVGGIDLSTLTRGSSPAASAIDRVALSLGTLVGWQQAKDWPAIADGLEYELAPALVGWRDVLAAITSSSKPDGARPAAESSR
jgi:hypothetical protein